MANTALADNLKYLQESGFSAQQAESLLQITQKQTKELLESVQEQVNQTEAKMVTKGYLDLQVENIKKSLIIQVGGVMLSGLLLLGWYINHLDNKTRAYIEARFAQQEARFAQQEARFEAQDTRFNDFKDNVNARFDKIESDLKDIKNFIFSRFSAVEGKIKTPK